MKNLWSKSVDYKKAESSAYLTVRSGDWTYYVLKAYQARAAEKTNLYARWFCKVVTPMTGPSGDLGDTYISDIPLGGFELFVLAEREAAEAAASKTTIKEITVASEVHGIIGSVPRS